MWSHIKNIFASPESKSSRTGRLISLEGGGRARWTPRDYTALAREGYARNAIVYRAVRLIAESVGSLCFVLYEGAAERDAHPLLEPASRRLPLALLFVVLAIGQFPLQLAAPRFVFLVIAALTMAWSTAE